MVTPFPLRCAKLARNCPIQNLCMQTMSFSIGGEDFKLSPQQKVPPETLNHMIKWATNDIRIFQDTFVQLRCAYKSVSFCKTLKGCRSSLMAMQPSNLASLHLWNIFHGSDFQ